MNKKWLEIYKKYRERKYNRDLDKLRNDLANRGLTRSGIRDNEERWLKEDYEDEVSMKKEEAEIQIEKSKEIITTINTSRILVAIAICSFFLTLFVSIITIRDSKETLELNYLPSIDVQYDLPNENIQIYNRGRTNLYLWGVTFNGELQSGDNIGRLITPSGLPYHFPGKDLNQILTNLLGDKENIYVPFELFFKDDRGVKYISKNYFFVQEIGVDVQTTAIERKAW